MSCGMCCAVLMQHRLVIAEFMVMLVGLLCARVDWMEMDVVVTFSAVTSS